MKTAMSVLFSIIVSSVYSQAYIIKYDSSYTAVCSKNLSYNEMVGTKKYEITKQDTFPGVITIHLGMMIVFGIGGEAFIDDVKENSKSMVLNTTFKGVKHIITLQENVVGNKDLIFEYNVSETQKCVNYFPNVKLVF
jgi:hypothetical protein